MSTGNPPKGSAEWLEEERGTAQTAPTGGTQTAGAQPAPAAEAPKGTSEWAEQNSGGNAAPAAANTAATVPASNTAAQPATQGGTAAAPGDGADGWERSKTAAVKGLDDQIAAILEAAKRYKPESKEDREKRERKERSQKIMAAVGDGLAALSNLFFTTRGAPNMYDFKTQSQQTPLQKRLEEARKEREADADKYLNYSLKLGDLNSQRAATLRELEAERERRKLAAEKAEREAEAHGWKRALQPDVQKEQQEKANKAASEAAKAKAEADNAADYYKGKVDEVKSRTNKNNRQGTSSWVGGRSGSGGRGQAKWPVFDKDGKVVRHVQTKDEGVSESVRIGGKYPETVSVTDGTNEYGDKTHSKTRRTPTADRPKPQKPTYSNTKALGL